LIGLKPLLYEYPEGAVEIVFFNHKEHKEGTKYTKLKSYISELCDLCVNPL
jgi:hypothetical protein